MIPQASVASSSDPGFESSDIKVSAVVYSAVGISAAVAIICAVLSWGLAVFASHHEVATSGPIHRPWSLGGGPEGVPLIETTAAGDEAAYRASQRERLRRYSVGPGGEVRIPIAEARRIALRTDILPVRAEGEAPP